MKWLKRAIWELAWVAAVAVFVSTFAAYVGTAMYVFARWALARLGVI